MTNPELQIQHDNVKNDNVNFPALWKILLENKIRLVIITAIFSISSIFTVLMIPNDYRSEVMLAPVNEADGGIAGLLSKFGGLANLAGINIGKKKLTKPSLAFEILKSRFFIKKFIERHNILVPLMASDGWDEESDLLHIDPDDYDVKTNKWVRSVIPPKKVIPTDREAYDKFLNIMSINRDKDSGLYSIALISYSPTISKKWLDWIVLDLNSYMKNLDIQEAEKSIEYLSKELESTNLSKMQNVFYQLIEEQTKTIMLAKVRTEYVFKTIDPAVIPDEKHSPRRALIVIFVTLLGAIIGIVSVLINRTIE